MRRMTPMSGSCPTFRVIPTCAGASVGRATPPGAAAPNSAGVTSAHHASPHSRPTAQCAWPGVLQSLCSRTRGAGASTSPSSSAARRAASRSERAGRCRCTGLAGRCRHCSGGQQVALATPIIAARRSSVRKEVDRLTDPLGSRDAYHSATCSVCHGDGRPGGGGDGSIIGRGREAGHRVPCGLRCVRGKLDKKSQVFPRFLLRNTRGRGAKSQPGGSIDRFRRQQQNLSIWQQIPVSSIDRAKIGCWPR
jgi:hypothetical protein